MNYLQIRSITKLCGKTICSVAYVKAGARALVSSTPRHRTIASAATAKEPSLSSSSIENLPPFTLPRTPSSLDQSPPPLSPKRASLKAVKPFSSFLTDTFSRQHDYLRISITERCNLRCLYCMPEEGVPLSPQPQLLTTPEIAYLSSLFVSQGVTKIRLTGGEPTIRRDILPLMHDIGELRRDGLKELCLTTNGITLHRKLDSMVEAGLTGVNLSLDTLDPFQFQIMTRRKGFEAVMRSIDRILEMNKLGAGIKLKVNCVVMRGINEREILPFVEMGREKEIEVRFIEYMPFDGNKWSKGKMLSYREMLEIIKEKHPSLRKVKDGQNETSKTFEVPGFQGKVGFITSMTHNFCGSCNRLRITSDGNLKVCLFGNAEVSLRDMLRQHNDGNPIDEEAWEAMKRIEMDRRQARPGSIGPLGYGERENKLLELIGIAVKGKKEKHAGMGELENMKNRPMILIDDTQVQDTTSLWTLPQDFTCTDPQSQRSLSSLLNAPTKLAFPHRLLQIPPACFHLPPTNLFSTTRHFSTTRLHHYPPPSPLNPPNSPTSAPTTSSSPSPSPSPTLPHLTAHSEIHIVPITTKPRTHRLATAIGHIVFSNPNPHRLILNNALRKGDVLSVARVAGVMAAKKTSEWIPLCHNGVGLEHVLVAVYLVDRLPSIQKKDEIVDGSGTGKEESERQKPIGAFGGVRIQAHVECEGKTGVEMEALTAVVGAGLTVVDMCKGADKGLRMEGVRVVRKEGGRSGDWKAEGWKG